MIKLVKGTDDTLVCALNQVKAGFSDAIGVNKYGGEQRMKTGEKVTRFNVTVTAAQDYYV